MTGIILGFELAQWTDPLFTLSFVLVALFVFHQFIGIKNNLFWTISCYLAFTGLGLMLQLSNDSEEGIRSFEEKYTKGDFTEVSVEEIGKMNSDWIRVKGQIQCVYHNRERQPMNLNLLLFVQKEGFVLNQHDVICLSSEILPIENKGNPGEFDAKKYWSTKGLKHIAFVGHEQYILLDKSEPGLFSGFLSKSRNYLKGIMSAHLKDPYLGVAMALVLGDKSELDQETRSSFANTGATHLLAVSGLHIGIIMQILLTLFAKFHRFVKRNIAIIIVVALMWGYAVLTGLSPSVTRAVFMFSVLSLSQLISRSYNPLNSLFFSAFVLLVLEPLVLFDVGFQLSFLAMLGIFLFYEKIEDAVVIEHKWLNFMWKGVAVGLAAQLMTSPLSLYYFQQFPNYFLLSNLVLILISGWLLGLGIFFLVVGKIPVLNMLTGAVFSASLLVLLFSLEQIESIPGALAVGFSLNFWIVIVLTLLVMVVMKTSKKRLLYASFVGLFILIGIIQWDRHNNLNREEVFVMNYKSPLITFRTNDLLYVFYDAYRNDDPKMFKLVNAYALKHDLPIKYQKIEDRRWKLNGKDFKLELYKKREGVYISVNKKKYLVLSDRTSIDNKKDIKRIALPWSQTNADVSLIDGAFKIYSK